MTTLTSTNSAVESRLGPSADVVDRPHPVWWFVVLGGLTLLALKGFSSSFHAWWSQHVYGLPSRALFFWIFLGCIPIHVYEAIYVYRLAHRLGMVRSAAGWSLQTFFLGYPSTHLIRKRKRQLESQGERP